MTNSSLSALTISQLKVIAQELDIYHLQGSQAGDKRRKQFWIDAIEAAQASETLTQPEDDFEAVVMSIDCDSITETTAKLFVDTFGKSVDEPWDSTGMCDDVCAYYALQVSHDYLANTHVNYIATKFPRLSKAHGWDGSYLTHNCADSIKNEYCMKFDTFFAAEAYWLAEIEKGYLSAGRIKIVKFDASSETILDAGNECLDDEPWDSTDICGESEPVEPTPSTKKGSVSVAASIFCLLIFALTALCQILSVSIKYGCLLAMLFGSWNPNLDIWYQLTNRTASKRLSTASA